MAASQALMNCVAKASTHEVKIKLIDGPAGKRKIAFEDEKDHVVRMDLTSKIKWRLAVEGKAFWIVFEDRTPFDRHVISLTELAAMGEPLLPGVFKYHVVLDEDRTVRLDPVIIIDPPTP
jgi:hypothetical protein